MTTLKYININNEPIDIIFPADFVNLSLPSKSTNSSFNKTNISFNSVINFNYNENYGFNKHLYNQVHIIKERYNFGFVSDQKSAILELWNAFKIESKNITSINYNNLYDVYLNSVTLPITIEPYKNIIFNMTVEKDGEVNVNGNIQFSFGGEILNSNILLTRAFLFDFSVNYINNINQTYSFYTEILKSKDSTEQRISYLTNNRTTFEYLYTVTNKDRRDIDKVLYSGFNNFIALPVYTETSDLISVSSNILTVDITNTSIQKNMNILIKDNNNKEIFKVVDIIDNNTIVIENPLINTYINGVVIPLLNVRLDIESSATRITNEVSTYLLTFIKEIDDIDSLVTNNNTQLNKINEITLFDIEPNRTEDITYNYHKNINILDNGTSRKEFILNNKIPEISFNYKYTGKDKEEISKLKNMFNLNKGMFGEVYSFSFNNNFNVVENISADDTIIIVENDNLTSYYKDNKIKYAVIDLYNSKKIIEITNIYEIDDNKEALIISAAIGMNINKDDINSCQFIFRGRLGSDDLTLSYYNNSVADSSLVFVKNSDVE